MLLKRNYGNYDESVDLATVESRALGWEPHPEEKTNKKNKSVVESKKPVEAFKEKRLPGMWASTIIKVDRVQKVIKGGVIMTYRTLVVVGNGTGAGGYGMGRGKTPAEAAARAVRNAKNNLVVVDRYKNAALTHNLEGRHNNLKVVLRAVPPGYGLKGSPMAQQILLQMGISDCTAKAHGRRHPYAVVRALFKALARHTTLHDVSRTRGRRILDLEWRRGCTL